VTHLHSLPLTSAAPAAVDRDVPVGELAARHPLATRVFARHHIDFCCGGGRPLGDVCDAQGLNVDTVLGEIHAIIDPTGDTGHAGAVVVWMEAPLPALIDHILVRYHATLREELPRLESMARKVARVHGDKDPVRLEGMLENLLALKGELETHMLKEEHVLFPAIREGLGARTGGPVAMMVHEHAEVGELLRQMRDLTGGYTVPAGACNTWRALWHGLEALEDDLHEHIHLENNVLFPRALAEA
jgi:regulator of cell morphogenesis and NO signaling